MDRIPCPSWSFRSLRLACLSALLAILIAGSLPLTSAQPADTTTNSNAEPAATLYAFDADLLYREPSGDAAQRAAIDERCRLDVYHPTDRPGFATVVFFHAGGLRAGRRFMPGELREQGIAVVPAGYRLSPTVEAPTYIEDAAAAVAWVFEHIGEYGGDADRVYVSGASAGAYLSLMLALDRRWLAEYDIDADRLAGVISITGQAITHVQVRADAGVPRDRPVIDDLAPLYHVRPDAPPMLLITGDRDLELLGRYEENAYLARMLKLVGHRDVTLHELGGHNHAQVTRPALPMLLRWVREREDASSHPTLNPPTSARNP